MCASRATYNLNASEMIEKIYPNYIKYNSQEQSIISLCSRVKVDSTSILCLLHWLTQSQQSKIKKFLHFCLLSATYWRTVGFLPTSDWYLLKWNKTSKYNLIIYAAKSVANWFRLSTEATSENDIVGESESTNFKFWKFIQNEWVHYLPYDFIRIEGNSHNVLSHPQPWSLTSLLNVPRNQKTWEYQRGWKNSLAICWVTQILFLKMLEILNYSFIQRIIEYFLIKVLCRKAYTSYSYLTIIPYYTNKYLTDLSLKNMQK